VLAVDPGFQPDGVMTASVSLPRSRYTEDASQVAFVTRALEGLRVLPGVASAGVTDTIPFGDNQSDSVILAEGYQMAPGESLISPQQVSISPGYFETMQATLVKGRFFDERDHATAPKVIIIDQKLANRFWPNQDPLGRRMYRASNDPDHLIDITDKTVFFQVVGVVADMKLHSLTEGTQGVGAYYFPLAQMPSTGLTFAVKTAADPAALTPSIRNAIAAVDRELPIFSTQSMNTLMEKSLVSRRSPVLLSLSFGIVALFLSALGIYGVLAYLVTQRTKEIGIRMALGSSSGAVFELVLREGLLLIAGGFVLGAAGAIALRRSLQAQLFGVSATDPVVLATVTIVLALVAVLACALPARRATRIDPLVALAE
jgi:predicted permease